MGDEKELKTYEVTVTVDYVVTVEAEDEDGARAEAHGQWRDSGDEVLAEVTFLEEVG